MRLRAGGTGSADAVEPAELEEPAGAAKRAEAADRSAGSGQTSRPAGRHRHGLPRLLTACLVLICLGSAALFGLNSVITHSVNHTVATLNSNLTTIGDPKLTHQALARLEASQRQVDTQLKAAEASRAVQLPSVRAGLETAVRTAAQLDQAIAAKKRDFDRAQSDASSHRTPPDSSTTSQTPGASDSSPSGSNKPADDTTDQAEARQRLEALLRQNAAPTQGSTGKTGEGGGTGGTAGDGAGGSTTTRPW